MSTAFTSSLLVASSAQLQTTEKELTWTPEAMIQAKIISDVQISFDNESVLFVVTEPQLSEKKGSLLSKIYRRDVKESSARLFSSPNTSSAQPRWSPDGKWIAFLSTRDGIKNLYLISSEGGEAKALTSGKEEVQTFCWSPDNEKIAFVMKDESEASRNEKNTSPAYIHNAKSTLNRLWLLDVFSSNPTPKPLTSDDYCVRGCTDFRTINTEFDWSLDSKKIIFAYSPSTEFDHLHLDSSLATVDITTGHITPFEKQALFEAMPRYSPDGKEIAYISGNSHERYSIDRQVAICTAEGKNHRLLSLTHNEGPFLAGPNLLGWSHDGKSILFFEPKETKFHLMRIPVDGSPAQEVDTGNTFFKDPSLSPDRSMLGFIAQTPSIPPEAYVAKIDDFAPIQLSTFNESFLSYPKVETEVISWTSKDGLTIQGLLTYPVGYDRTRQYPLLVVIHGGPMAFFDESFLGLPYPYPIASFAQNGFFILRPNPRGSTGYGKAFRSANYKDWGGGDGNDIISGIDLLVDKGIVDPERLGVMGWSYGGYMTAWLITQTDRFKAASIGAGVSNIISMNGTTDLYRFITDYLGDWIDNRALYETRSPINYVQNISTPCLIQHGTDDKRVPVSQSYELYHALHRLEKETQLVLYPGMAHSPSDPKMLLDAMERNLAWFQKHLRI